MRTFVRDLWVPQAVVCNYQLPRGRHHFNKATRDDYNGTVKRQATPVFTAFGQGAGQGTLWVGTKAQGVREQPRGFAGE